MAYSIINHLQFNAWANTKTAEVLRTVPDEIYFKENKSSFPSIAKTIWHIYGAQEVWLKRMQGESLSAFPDGNSVSKEDALNELVRSSEELLSFIQLKDEDFLTSLYKYKNLKGDSFEDPVEDTLFHVVNHGTYHRGQIVTMLREAGITNLASTDLIHYLRGLKK